MGCGFKSGVLLTEDDGMWCSSEESCSLTMQDVYIGMVAGDNAGVSFNTTHSVK